MSENLGRAVDLQYLDEDKDYRRLVVQCRVQISSIIAGYWEIGRLVSQFMSEETRKERYGKSLYLKIAKDIGLEHSTLYRAIIFYHALPDEQLRDVLLEMAWSRLRMMFDLLENPVAQQEILTNHRQIAEMPKTEFFVWLQRSKERFLDGPALEKRTEAQNRHMERRFQNALDALRELGKAGGFTILHEDLDPEPGAGFVSVIAFKKGVGSREKTIEYVQSLIQRLSA